MTGTSKRCRWAERRGLAGLGGGLMALRRMTGVQLEEDQERCSGRGTDDSQCGHVVRSPNISGRVDLVQGGAGRGSV